ncbi:MAG: prepilin-type N-terminal cleavage/methylation domain-containing protein [Lactobacillales bacterium]|jgi:competence protein ComGC|nr:prepilin-type N-terminal cleavage/methylation domain-containing protein [Lactobacillales bacterium]
MKKWRKEMAGFTLVETLIVLLILSILILIMVPNLMQHKDFAEKKSDEALIHVVESQMTMYELEKAKSEKPSLEELENDGFITRDQKEKYKRIMKKEQ